MFFDSHCHLQDKRIAHSLNEIIERARNAGVRGFLCCASNEGDWQEVEKIAKNNLEVFEALGLHPWYVMERSAEWLDKLEEILKKNPASCVGEIGLDHCLGRDTFAVQESVFIDQLRLSAKLNRPVSIHCRKAFGRMLGILKEHSDIRISGAIHSYSGPPDLVPAIINAGLHISFSGSLTFPNSKRAHASAAIVPADRLLVETDSPDIKPFGCASFVNEPANIVFVIEKLAEIRKVSVEEIELCCWENAKRLFRSCEYNEKIQQDCIH
jgi:TatD DNase family protein